MYLIKKYNLFKKSVIIEKEKRNTMLDIRHVKGILIAPDGSFRSFGVHSDAPTEKLTDINFHDSAFKMKVSGTKWFKNLKQKYGLDYNNYTITRQGMDWASKGMILFVHAGASPVDAYYVLTPEQMSSKQSELFKESYEDLKKQITDDGSYFEGYIFDPNGGYATDGAVYGLDDFYERMGLTAPVHVSKHHR